MAKRMQSKLRVLVVGYGYWGPNLVRNLVECPHTEAAGICELDNGRREKAGQVFPFVPCFANLDQALEQNIDAVIIATPAASHHELAAQCLDADKHVLLEKPMTRTAEQARDLIARARRARRVLMVDHTFLYSQAIRLTKEMIDSGELGDICYIDSVRINLGLVQSDINVFWDLAPHDLSIIDHLLDRSPEQISALGKAHVNEQEDVGLVTLNYGPRLMAGVHLNWLSPVKIRRTVIGGSRKSIVLNDLDPTEKLRVYDRSVGQRALAEGRHRLLIDYRLGDMWCPHVGTEEPLQNLIQHFAECIEHGRTPLSDGFAGLRIVEMLEAIDRSLAANGAPIDFETASAAA